MEEKQKRRAAVSRCEGNALVSRCEGRTPVSRCAGCGQQILDRLELKVFPDLRWHAQCLRCAECQQNLAESHSCFIRDGRTLCRNDYRRLYSSRCAGCLAFFSSRDYVMRAGVHIYHVPCFRCGRCDRRLRPGDEFTLRDGFPLCAGHMTHRTHLDSCTDGAGTSGSGSERGARMARMRTVLSEAQLHVLRSCYDSNPRPDALLKEQLVELTGLSSRVIRVWFQNKRCKDKKRNLLLTPVQVKMLEEPLFIRSPEMLDTLMKPLDLQNLQPCWKLLTSYSLSPDDRIDQTSGQQPDCLSERRKSLCSTGNQIMGEFSELQNRGRNDFL